MRYTKSFSLSHLSSLDAKIVRLLIFSFGFKKETAFRALEMEREQLLNPYVTRLFNQMRLNPDSEIWTRQTTIAFMNALNYDIGEESGRDRN